MWCELSTVAWVTRPECPKGAKDEVKEARRAKRRPEGPKGGPKGLKLEVWAPRLLVPDICKKIHPKNTKKYLKMTLTSKICIFAFNPQKLHLIEIC